MGSGPPHRACFWCRASWQPSVPVRSSSPGTPVSCLASPPCPEAAGWPPGGSGRPCSPYPLQPRTASPRPTWLLLAAPASGACSGSAQLRRPLPAPPLPAAAGLASTSAPQLGPAAQPPTGPHARAGPASGQRAADYSSQNITRPQPLESKGAPCAACRESESSGSWRTTAHLFSLAEVKGRGGMLENVVSLECVP